MTTIVRYSRNGLQYILEEIDAQRTHIKLAGRDSAITVDAPLDRIAKAWNEWRSRGAYIQDAFWFMTPDEREFLISGLTPTEWDKMFADDMDAE